MKSRNSVGKAWIVVGTALFLTAAVSPSWGQANSPGELRCHAALTKAVGKHTAAVTKAMAACRNSVLAGAPGPCPDATAQAAIAKAVASTAKVASSCQSACSVSLVPCIGGSSCPPNGQLPENCTDAGRNFFESAYMGFPGPYCNAVIDAAMANPADFSNCASGLSNLISVQLLNNLYGDINGTPPLSDNAANCLAALVKSAPKSASKMAATVSKCRNAQLAAGTPSVFPNDCATADAKTADGVDKTRQKFLEKVSKSCDIAAITELDLCGAGIGGISGPTAVAEAQACLGDVLEQSSVSVADANDRPYAKVGIINAAYPSSAQPRCGDNLVNQAPSQFFLNGEECDGDDDDACPELCVPPGDTFECTCSNIRRSRSFADGFSADLDIGWSGSHNAKMTEEAGFVAEVSNCNCTLFDPLHPATCIDGVANDKVCDVFSEVNPRCSNRIGDHTTCDEVGNRNGSHADTDCQACDAFAANAGDYCTGISRFCIGGTNTGDACNDPGDCPGGACTGNGSCIDGLFQGNGCSGPQHCGVCTAGNIGNVCAVNSNCGPGGVCQGHTCATRTCIDGANEGDHCTSDSQCSGGRCAEKTDCTSQCYPDAGGPPTGLCARQADCVEGERCRGVCDWTSTCVKVRNGAPLPLSAKGASVCIDSQFFSNVTGTRNIVTGEQAISYELRWVVSLANELSSVPCPVCGGYCADTPDTSYGGFRCEGSCTGPAKQCRFGANIGSTCTDDTDCDGALCTAVACRFDIDCAGNGTCDGASSPECQGKECRLDLSCQGGPNAGEACRIEANTAFGTTSSDCPADPSSNKTGQGLTIKWQPLTNGAVSIPDPAPCDAAGYQNFDCNCVTGDGGTRNQPNQCQPACTAAGANYGRACDSLTVCEGGLEAGAACDQNADCSGGGTCTGNPRVCGIGSTGVCSVRHCLGGAVPGTVCASDVSCLGGGTCSIEPCTVGGPPCTDGACRPDACSTNTDCEPAVTCDDVCPGGLCTPLCAQRGVCDGGSRAGEHCALDEDCDAGGTCVPGDVEEGACAQGRSNHCNGPGWEFVSCAPLQVGTQQGCEAGADDVVGNWNDQIGAGYCEADVTSCFINNGAAQGGSTLDGKGDPTNDYSVAGFCIGATSSSAINSSFGLPGPGRIRQPSTNVVNFSTLP